MSSRDLIYSIGSMTAGSVFPKLEIILRGTGLKEKWGLACVAWVCKCVCVCVYKHLRVFF